MPLEAHYSIGISLISSYHRLLNEIQLIHMLVARAERKDNVNADADQSNEVLSLCLITLVEMWIDIVAWLGGCVLTCIVLENFKPASQQVMQPKPTELLSSGQGSSLMTDYGRPKLWLRIKFPGFMRKWPVESSLHWAKTPNSVAMALL